MFSALGGSLQSWWKARADGPWSFIRVLETHGIHVDKVGFEENTSASVGGYTQMTSAL